MPDSVEIDGWLDEPAWQRLDLLRILRNHNPAVGTPSSKTKALVGMDMDWAPKGMQHAVKIRGTLNQPGDLDTGISVEIVLPWEGFSAWSKKELPPRSGPS